MENIGKYFLRGNILRLFCVFNQLIFVLLLIKFKWQINNQFLLLVKTKQPNTTRKRREKKDLRTPDSRMPKEMLRGSVNNLQSHWENRKGKFHRRCNNLSRDELYKRRRGFGGGQAAGQQNSMTDAGAAIDDSIDFEKYSI